MTPRPYQPVKRRIPKSQRRRARLATRLQQTVAAVALAVVVLDQVDAIPLSSPWRGAVRALAAFLVAVGVVSKADARRDWRAWLRRRD